MDYKLAYFQYLDTNLKRSDKWLSLQTSKNQGLQLINDLKDSIIKIEKDSEEVFI